MPGNIKQHPQRGQKALSAQKRAGLQHLLNSAITAHQANRLAAAERDYLKVLKVVPEHPVSLNLLAVIHIGRGKNARAIQLLQKAVAVQPDFADAHNHLGIVLRKMGRTKEAVVHFQKAAVLDPALFQAHNNLGNAQKDLMRFAEAAKSYRAAISLSPGSFEPHFNLGIVLKELEQIAPALESYKSALKIDRENAEAWFNLGALLERQHRLDEALDAVSQALTRTPSMASAAIVKARILRRKGELEKSAAVLEALAAASLTPDDAISAAFELGKTYDAGGQTARAFSQFENGNRLQKSAVPKKLLREAERFCADLSESAGQIKPGIGDNWRSDHLPDSGAPVFLIGFPRSGTTLLDQVLDAHSGVQVMEERAVVAGLAKQLKVEGWTFPADFAALDEARIKGLRARYFEQVAHYLDRREGLMLIDKMPLNIIHVPLLARIFPESHFVFSLRHPFDVVLSNFMQLFQLNPAMANFLDLETAAHSYECVMRLWRKSREVLPLRVHTVRYENLVQDLESEVRPLLEFLELEWQGAMLDPAAHARKRRAINTPSYEQVAEPVYQKSKYRWRRYQVQLQPVIGRLTPWAIEFGYDVDGSKT